MFVDLDGLRDLISRLPKGAVFGVESLVDTEPDENVPQFEPVAEPAPRRIHKPSKVETEILGALQAGPLASSELRTALAEAGLSEGSVSRLTTMKKEGKVEQTEDGKWKLAA